MAKQDDYTKTALRLPRELHQKLLDAASARGHSLNTEMVYRLDRSFDPTGNDDQSLENSLTLKMMRDALVDIARNANVHEDATRAMGRDLSALCREALPIVENEVDLRDLMLKLGDVGTAMQADDLADAQGRLRALLYRALEYAHRSLPPEGS
ncbi:Arc family DNA-binding protein [Paraburkholderia caledonica]|uniref:Arc-like DNA binding domain-containing protein n=1 Tax=Paraburkholderia caledonica TaxID=134536 RepID=A0AB73INZ1_9BURK|nr:hypothetical protein [Paraburkholderia caledonica]